MTDMPMNAPVADQTPALLLVADLKIDTRTRTVSRKDSVVDLPDLSYRLLLCLVLHAPSRVSKDQLITEVWQGLVVSDETLAQRVRLLRQVLGESSQDPRYIASVRNQGYRLIAPVCVPEGNQPKTKVSSLWKTLLALGSVLLIGIALLVDIQFLNEDGAGVEETSVAIVHTLAVLPFTDMSAGADQRYFADGIHEELLSRLSRVSGFSVVSRTSVMPYRSTELSIPEIAARLGVDNILEGSVRLMDDRVRITAQLIDAKSDRHLWSDSFERELTMQNLFAIQSEVASNIAKALELELSGSDRSRFISLPTEQLEAYNFYLLGRYYTFALTPDHLSRAVEFLRQAIKIDEQFAEAWATLGWAYSFQGTAYGNSSPRMVYPKAREAALRALALDAGLADAHALYADILTWYDWDWSAAEREYLATLELDPNNALGYALFLGTQLRHREAMDIFDRLTQRYPDNEYIHINAAWGFLRAREYERVLYEAGQTTGNSDTRRASGWALLATDRVSEALVLFEQDLLEDSDSPGRISNLAVANIRAGEFEKAQSMLDILLVMTETQYVPPDAIAAIYFEQKNPDTGFDWLYKARDARSRGMIFLQVDHVYDAYRTDPRYLALAAEMGFTKH